MANNDQYALNWNNHTNHIKKAFNTLLQRDEYVDVTISCEGKKIKAHKMILSACSVYFHDLLQENPCPHPIIILRDFHYENIKSIISFMYNGEVQVPIENFGSFLKTAELLEISGLMGDSQTKDITNAPVVKKDTDETSKERSRPAPASKKMEMKKKLAVESRKRSSDEDSKQIRKKKEKSMTDVSDEEGMQLRKKKEKSIIDDYVEDDNGSKEGNDDDHTDEIKLSEPITAQRISQVQELLSANQSYLTKESNPECECPICAQKFNSIYHLKQHIPFHLGETKCQYCGSVYGRRDSLKKHLIQVHKINPSDFK